MNIEEKIDMFLQEQTTTASVARYKKRIGSKQKTNKDSIVVNITSEDKEKELEFLKNLVRKYQDKGVILNSQLGPDEGNIELVLPHHLIDEIKGKLEKRKNLEITG